MTQNPYELPHDHAEAYRRFHQEQQEYCALAFQTFVQNEAGRVFLEKTLKGLHEAEPITPGFPEFQQMLVHQNGMKAMLFQIQQCIKAHERLSLSQSTGTL